MAPMKCLLPGHHKEVEEQAGLIPASGSTVSLRRQSGLLAPDLFPDPRTSMSGRKAGWAMNATAETANYFGLRVEVINRMEDCSLIRFQGREFVVDTADLVTIQVCAA